MTNTKPFFWESEASLGLLQKVSPFFGVSYNFPSSINRIFWVIEFGSRLYNGKFCQQIQNHFFRKARQTLKPSKNLLLMLEFPKNLCWSLPKIAMESSASLNLASSLYTHINGKARQPFGFSTTFFPMLEFPLNLFWSLPKTEIESSEWLNIGSRLYNAKFGRVIQNHFRGKATQILKLCKNFLSKLEFPINLILSIPKA